MKVHEYERAFLLVGAGMLVLFLFALFYSSISMGIHLPDAVARVDPATVRESPPFDNPGVRQTAPDAYEVVLIGQAWSFDPAEIRVPAGAEITIIATSTDVIHGVHVESTRINMMLIPGQVSRTTYTFKTPGEYLMVCHEYCGSGHHFMFGKVIVE